MRHQAPPSTSPETQQGIQEMPNSISLIPDDPTIGSSIFDWSEFLEFDLDDPFADISFDPGQRQEKPTGEPEPEDELTRVDELGRSRKRDQRLVCPNYLAGRIPCACPELDEKLEQEAEMLRGAGAGKKRARSLRASAGTTARCQVPNCEADISELKGYHRRHRVCLQCAHASTVILDGQDKRYCQQCAKFHVLSYFDEGKHSCRRKLERHNNRRRRKPADGKGSGERESHFTTQSVDVSCEDDTSKDSMCLINQTVDKEAMLESEAQVSALCSAHDSDNVQGDSIVSFVGLSETQIDQGKENPKSNQSVTCDDHKSPFSSVCTTGRISFKLYDWNPAEFPRRLRHQIFQWLASMPVELEGYIRPGCTILTIFIAMPKFMWVKLFEEPACQLHDFVISPGNLLHGRGTFFTYLNNMKFSILQEMGGTSVAKLLASKQVPRLHYVQPMCFEAGKPLEFVVCGSNLLQPKSRFLVSFAGKYLAHDFSVLPLCENTEDDGTVSNHQLVKVSASQTDPKLFGPAFVEVENESGLSNFIPILIADANIVAEMKKIEQRFYAPRCSEGPGSIPSSSCQVSALKQVKLLELITEVAWSVKKPVLENTRPWTSFQTERTDKLLNFLIASESTATLDRVLYCLKTRADNKWAAEVVNADREHLQRSMHNARSLICQKLQQKGNVVGRFLHHHYLGSLPLVLPSTVQGVKGMKTQFSDPSPELNSTFLPLLNGEVVMRLNVKERSEKSCSPLLTNTAFTCRPFISVITAATLCLGLCAVLLHPQKVGELAVTIQECVRFRTSDLHD